MKEEGKFSHVASELSELLRKRVQEGGGISVEDIAGCVGKEGKVNCYPSTEGRSRRERTEEKTAEECHSTAFFVSIEGASAMEKKDQGHLNFCSMMDEFKEHMHEKCFGRTKHVVMISNSCYPEEYEDYYIYIDRLRKVGVTVEAYFISEYGSILVDI